MATSSNSPVGIFDSGVGGISVLRAIREQMPQEAILYLGDQGHIPYGPRPMEQIRSGIFPLQSQSSCSSGVQRSSS
jgi:glutamate racemase